MFGEGAQKSNNHKGFLYEIRFDNWNHAEPWRPVIFRERCNQSMMKNVFTVAGAMEVLEISN
jgi:hypothetical protein